MTNHTAGFHFDAQCGLLGRDLVRINVSDVDSNEISIYCGILAKLDLIEVVSFTEYENELAYPVCITPEGHEFLGEANKKFWDYAQAAALDAAEKLTGIKFHNAVAFFKATYQKYRQEKGC